jgi:DNA-binding transcriptional MerR regulator
MSKRLRELLQALETEKAKVRSLLAEDKVLEAEKAMEEVRSLQKQVALQQELEALEETDLSLEHEPGKHRFYSKRNVNELKYILRLIKNDGLSVKQVHEFLSSPEGKLAAPIFDQQTKFRELIEIMTSRVDGTIKDVVKREIENSFSSVFSETLKNAADKLPSKEDVEGIKIEINSLSEKTRSDYKALERNMEKIMEELQENKREKGLFGRLFGK